MLAATTAEVLAELDPGLLADWERRRLRRIRVPARRADVTAARLLLRRCVAEQLGCLIAEVTIGQVCPECDAPGHGRPYLPGRPDTGISLSHADGMVAVAAGPGPVGIDLEPLDRPLPRPLHRLFPQATGDPARLLRLWVRREAELKSGGTGLPVREWTDRRLGAVLAVAGGPAAA
ncbi:4-phosphopantetheinyl transferase [Kitasatospora sp. NBC_01287]|uniref:4'-phosphopantetheinyl transferase family protein n=1 Tax=Kitasatospora sp. NBC_01287 TaxID=2903573 RepID=UPI00225494B1|nr:4-phosphopantetheinyl transferase [Kitasatospora sp. NBC_01287]MCX4751288.1 4-phosphopantetheinyl transferase [Kitasatospora sp. NBC_01287]